MAIVDHVLTVLMIAMALVYVGVRTRKAIQSARTRKESCNPDCCR